MHNHNEESSSSRLGWVFVLNFSFTIIEFIGGILTNSTAIMADAVHDLGDSLAIGMAWGLDKLSDKHADEDFTYGYRRLSLLGALMNGLILVAGSVWVLAEAVPRLSNPEMPMVEGMFWLAVFGIAVNGYAAYKLSRGASLNEKVLNWHLMEDVLGWVAVLIVSIVLMFVNWPILDPLLSIGFTCFILFNVARSFLRALKLFLQAVPDQGIRKQVLKQLLSVEQVEDVHHLHFWSLDGEHHVLTAHLVLSPVMNMEQLGKIKANVADVLNHYELEHTTIEFEFPDEYCRDAGS